LEYGRNSYDFSHLAGKREDIWWEKENWALAIDQENPWGDLSKEGELLLKTLLKA